jgi:hypothetical protein
MLKITALMGVQKILFRKIALRELRQNNSAILCFVIQVSKHVEA